MKRTKKAEQLAMFAAPVAEPVKAAPVVRDLAPEAERLLANFEVLAEAPGGVKRLREVVLALAVSGKLVRQDSTDEPSTDLLLRLDRRRTALLKEGHPNPEEASVQLRKQASQVLPEGLEPLPTGWAWTTLIQASLLLVDCHNKTAPYTDSGIRLLRTTNVRNGQLNLSEPKFVNESTYERWSARCKPEPGDIIITREAPMGEVCIIPAGMKVCLGQRMMLIRTIPKMIDTTYLLYSLMSPDLMDRVQDKPVGVTVQHLRVGGVETLLTPIPPLAEQKRIVAKVDELMKLCDELEARQAQERETGARLTKAALDALANAEGPEEVAASWERVVGNFEGLISHVEDVKTVRATVLSLAVRGRLVKHNPDEHLPMHQNDWQNAEFTKLAQTIHCPSGWMLAPLDELAEELVDCPHSTPLWTTSGKICVRTSQFLPGLLDLSHCQFVSEETFELRIQRLRPRYNDILYSREGGILGVACRIPPNVELCLGQRMMLIRAKNLLDPCYLELILNSPIIAEIARQKTTGGAAPRINVSTVKAYPIPVAPLAEQKRIVAKVDQLMALCDELETTLRQTEETSRKVAEALVAELVQPKPAA